MIFGFSTSDLSLISLQNADNKIVVDQCNQHQQADSGLKAGVCVGGGGVLTPDSSRTSRRGLFSSKLEEKLPYKPSLWGSSRVVHEKIVQD